MNPGSAGSAAQTFLTLLEGRVDLSLSTRTEGDRTVVIATHDADISRVIDRKVEIADGAIR